ncbi:integrin beta-1-B [Nothobranchius furzeri]|uniref:Transcript variant X1 n=1 Tax=Nothobranchius furzeri TaxID=105023 RepID=A0A9D2YVM5_NOTFU|nr:transcript variant X1 [Nothobranchius furzeri]KAF7227496.1 transcript variant X2 [Nothobranchius furzeri]
MAVELLGLLLLLALSHAEKDTCLKSAASCDECIQSDSACAWCTSPHAQVRCSTAAGLQSAGCHQRFIYNPKGSTQVVRNDTRSGAADSRTFFLQPQEVSLHLRPGVRQSFPLTVSMPTDQSYLPMDLSDVPAGVNITFRRDTKGNLHLLQVTVEAAECPSNGTGPWSILLTPRHISLSVKLEITLVCRCNCTGGREENSPGCSGRGALICGQCECPEPYIGQQCQTNSDPPSSWDEILCRSHPTAPVCSGRGSCVEGMCECNRRGNPTEVYSGRYCECSNFECSYHNDRLCGGKGRCECGRCACSPDWIGEACSCSTDTTSCAAAANPMLCNGKGLCVCGKCECEPPYSGPTCEDCPVC